MVHTQLWTKQSNVRTNTKYTSHVNSFNTIIAIYSNDLTKTKKHDIKNTKTFFK